MKQQHEMMEDFDWDDHYYPMPPMSPAATPSTPATPPTPTPAPTPSPTPATPSQPGAPSTPMSYEEFNAEMNKRHVAFLQAEFSQEQKIQQEKQKVWELEKEKDLLKKKREIFEELAEEGPYGRGFEALMNDPYFNPIPDTPSPSPAEPSKPDTPTPEPATPSEPPTPTPSPTPAPKPTPEEPATPAKPADPSKQPSNYYSWGYYY